MVKASKGIRRHTRGILTRNARDRGLSPITHTFQRFAEGERAAIVMDPSEHRGMPHMRFQGHTGLVKGRQGRSVVLEINVGGKVKTVIVRPEHLKHMP